MIRHWSLAVVWCCEVPGPEPAFVLELEVGRPLPAVLNAHPWQVGRCLPSHDSSRGPLVTPAQCPPHAVPARPRLAVGQDIPESVTAA